ncbi:hypothetical protein K523DRAFT_325283 [Schizophyllum commune Tattone D]|nr:hypothetical protein K523DRAFT_325283 [Schizophyllum commune Tattone D]
MGHFSVYDCVYGLPAQLVGALVLFIQFYRTDFAPRRKSIAAPYKLSPRSKAIHIVSYLPK